MTALFKQSWVMLIREASVKPVLLRQERSMVDHKLIIIFPHAKRSKASAQTQLAFKA